MSLFRRRLPRGMFIFFAPSLKAQGGRIQIQYKVGFSNEGTGEAAVHAWSWDSSVLKWLMPSQLCTWFYFCLSSKQGKWGGNRRIWYHAACELSMHLLWDGWDKTWMIASISCCCSIAHFYWKIGFYIVNELHSLVLIVAYREANKGLYMVARKFLLNCSAWLCLGPA